MGTEIKRCLIVSGAPEADIAYIKPLLPGSGQWVSKVPSLGSRAGYCGRGL